MLLYLLNVLLNVKAIAAYSNDQAIPVLKFFILIHVMFVRCLFPAAASPVLQEGVLPGVASAQGPGTLAPPAGGSRRAPSEDGEQREAICPYCFVRHWRHVDSFEYFNKRFSLNILRSSIVKIWP